MKEIDFEFPPILTEIAERIHRYEYHSMYLVGGAVIDVLKGREVKDWDVEVFGMSYSELVDILMEWGNPDLIGNKFGVVKLKADGYDFEFSIPRTESRIGPKHQDFDINLQPKLDMHDAATRRDFTVNALYLCVPPVKDMKAPLFDPHGGLKDLEEGILRHVNWDTFKDDPLRAFRGMQILARKLQTCSDSTKMLIKDMVRNGDMDNVPAEAIYGEFNKMLMKADGDGIYLGLTYLEDTGLLEACFPELYAMKQCQQKAKWHPEGDVLIHTKLVLRQAGKYRDELPSEWRLAFMWGLLLHDIGKPAVVDPETLSAIGHDVAGKDMARAFMERLKAPKKLTDMVVQVVGAHMRPRQLKKRVNTWKRLHNALPLNICAYVSMCDSDGRGFPPEGKDKVFQKCMEMFEQFGSSMDVIPPVVRGKHLIERGMEPGKEFGAVLKKAYERQISTGCEDPDKILNMIKGEEK